ncbi:MAG: hypothetical protein JSV90_04825 [Methanobacteriota archaeon]|nr:MAG: hypothetical protein JSV90_04825 [Euryarchaeota archaeon]
MATVSRKTLTSCIAGALLVPVTFVFLLQGLSTSPVHALPVDDFGDSIRVTFDPFESTNISSTVDVNGDMHVVWEDFRSGNGDVYYVKLDAEGNKLTNDAKISNDSAMSRHPSVAVDPAGHIYIVWESIENSSAELQFAKLWYYAGNITFQENGLQVSDADPANSTEPEIAVCADGNLVLVWTDARQDAGEGNLEIYYKRLSPIGFPLTPDTRITRDVGVSERPNLDIDGAGMIHVAWYDFRDSDDGLVVNHGVFYRKISPDGTALTNETRITFASPESRPDIAVDTDGNVHVVFDDDRYASFDVFYTLLDNDGITLVDDRNISPKDDNESRFPRVALSDSRVVDVVWQDAAGETWSIHYSAITYDGALEVYDQAITDEGLGNATRPVVMCARDNNTFVLYSGEVPNKEVFFSRTHRPDLSVLGGEVVPTTSQPLVGSTVWVNSTVRNLAGGTATGFGVALLVGGAVQEEIVVESLPAGSAVVLGFQFVAGASDTSIGIAVDIGQSVRETDESNNDVTIPLIVRIPGVLAYPDTSRRLVDPGETASFNITVNNTGNYAADYEIANSTLREGWSISYEPAGRTVTVPAAGSSVFKINVSVPYDIYPGTRLFNVTVACTDRTTVNATITLMVDVQQVGNVSVVTPCGGETLEPTVPWTCVFTVTNTANANESFLVEALDDLGWISTLSHTDVDLVPEESQNITVVVTPPRYESLGAINVLTLRLTSKSLTDNFGEGNVVLVAGHHREVDISLAQQAFLNYSVPEDRQIIYSLLVQNLGNCDDTVRVWLEGLSSFWAVLETSYVFLEPGEGETVSLTMTPGLSVLAGIYEFDVSAASEADPSANETIHMGVNVQPFYRIETYLDAEELVPTGGATVSTNLTIENWGNTIDTVNVYGFTESLNNTVLVIEGTEYPISTEVPPPFVLEPGNRAVITVTILLSDAASAGSYEIMIEAGSLSDPSVTSTEVITLVIPQKKPWFNLYTIILIAALVAAAVIGVLLFRRKKAVEEQRRITEERRRMQQRGKPGVRRRPRPEAKRTGPGGS